MTHTKRINRGTAFLLTLCLAAMLFIIAPAEAYAVDLSTTNGTGTLTRDKNDLTAPEGYSPSSYVTTYTLTNTGDKNTKYEVRYVDKTNFDTTMYNMESVYLDPNEAKTFTVTPKAGLTAGSTYSCTIVIYIQGGKGGETTLNFTVEDPNSPPSITSASSTFQEAGKSGSFQVTASGATPITYNISTLSDGVSINSSTGLMSFENDIVAGKHDITIVATNEFGNDTQNFVLTVGVPTPTLANKSNNKLEKTSGLTGGSGASSSDPYIATAGTEFTVTATGDRQDAAGAVNGDERYVPTNWRLDTSSSSFTKGGPYTASVTIDIEDTYQITVWYAKEVWDATQEEWVTSSDTDTKFAFIRVEADETDPTPTPQPSASPTPNPSASPTPVPSASPSTEPSASPTIEPTATPTTAPSSSPSPTSTDDGKTSPKTGDSTRDVSSALIVLIGLAGLAISIAALRRRKAQSK